MRLRRRPPHRLAAKARTSLHPPHPPATLVDVVSTAALLTVSKASGVSQDLNVTYLSAAKHGEDVIVDAAVLKARPRRPPRQPRPDR